MKKIRKNSVGRWRSCLACGKRKFEMDANYTDYFLCPWCSFWWSVDRDGLVSVMSLGFKRGFQVPAGCLLVVKETKR